MLTQLLTKEQINAQLERLDRKIKELETDDILGVIDEAKRTQEPPRIQLNKLGTNDILDIIDERSKRLQKPPRIQSNELETCDVLDIVVEPSKGIQEPPRITNKLETSDIPDILGEPSKRLQEPPRPDELENSDLSDIIDEPSKRIQEPPRIYEKAAPVEKSRLYQVGEFIVSAIAIILIIFAVAFTAQITATLWEIIKQFGFRQYVSVTILASILFGCGYFVGRAGRD